MHTNQSQYIHARSAITRTIYITKFFQVSSTHIENHPIKRPIARKLKIKAHTPNDHFTLRLPAKMKTSAATLLPNSKQKITKTKQASIGCHAACHQAYSRAIKSCPQKPSTFYLAPTIKSLALVIQHQSVATKHHGSSIERIHRA